MKKTFQLTVEGKNRDRVVDAIKHEVRKYMKRERRRELPAGVDFLDFDCRLGLTPESAEPVHPGSLIESIDHLANEGADNFYVEILAKPGHRKARAHAGAADDSAPDPAMDAHET